MNRVSRLVSFVLLIAIALSLVVVQCIPGSIEAGAESSFDDGKLIVVSLGDSYSSGEGIEPFYGQNKSIEEKVKDNNWLAHRSESSWAGRIHIEGMPEGKTLNDYNVDAGKADANSSIQWYFRASSGAKTYHLNSVMQNKKVIRWGFKPGEITTISTRILPKMRAFTIQNTDLPTQLSVIDDFNLKGKVDYVTLTIGGNDVNFAGIIEQCATESSYLTSGFLLKYELLKLWFGTKEDDGKVGIVKTRENIKNVYKEIEKAAGKQATIIVAGYPKLLDADGKGALFSKQEAAIVGCAVTKFNYILNSVVKECREEGMNIIFVDVEEKFDTKDDKGRRHQAYSGDAWLTPIMLLQEQDLDHAKLPPVSGYSMHPNDKGAAAYAECINNAIWNNDSTGHWHESSDYDYVFDKSKLVDMFKEIIDGKNRTKAKKHNEQVSFSPHTYGDWITEASTGKKYRKCTVCGYEDGADPGQGGDAVVDPDLLGDWYDDKGILSYTFRSDFTGYRREDDYEFDYFLDGDGDGTLDGFIAIVDKGDTAAEDYTYKVYNNVLTLTNEFERRVERYYRSPKGVTPPGGGSSSGGGGKSGGGGSGGGSSGAINGDWVIVESGGEVTVSFKNGKETIYVPGDSQTYSYTISGDIITVTHENNSKSVYRYEISGNKMYFYDADTGELYIEFKRK